jgi:outer membrane immunogenic protein
LLFVAYPQHFPARLVVMMPWEIEGWGLMKQVFLGSVAVAALLAIPAQAADMPVKAPLAPVVTTSWAGFYIGAHVGYGYANTAVEAPEANFGRFIGVGSKGWVAGGLAGYNVMLSPRWLAGIEVDGSWQDIKTKMSGSEGDLKLSLDWSASVRGRLGYLITPTTMVFGTFGWSWSELEISTGESVSRSVNGAQVGFGVETMYSDNWILRTEYLHSFYHYVTLDTFESLRMSPWVGVIRSALIYKLGPSTPTAWPDRAPTPIWSGLYVGGLIGTLHASAKLDAPSIPLTFDGIGVTGVLPSAMVGFNVLLAPRWLAGLEGEIAPNISTSDVKVEWTGAARVRAGYLVTPATLVYGSVGWATAGIETITRDGTSLWIPIQRVHALGVGTGVEAAISDRWRLRADYQYYWTNTLHITVDNIPINVKTTARTAKLGLIYAIGGP